jgi:hypothetical protein
MAVAAKNRMGKACFAIAMLLGGCDLLPAPADEPRLEEFVEEAPAEFERVAQCTTHRDCPEFHICYQGRCKYIPQ